jgi:glyoxylase-like metal-dependent hydrolase (beta-lactamase superfamily II)
MRPVEEFQQVSPRVIFWEGYEAAVKTDLSCSAVIAAEGLVFIDPIPLAPSAEEELCAIAAPCAVVVTSENHWRSAAGYARRFQIPLHAHPAAGDGQKIDGALTSETKLAGDLQVIEIEGAAAGEIALHLPGESLHVGDAIIHADPWGFSLLPDKYCSDPPLLRQSLRKLLRAEFRLLLFAHGTPLVTDACARLAQLLA